jgi:hypothetical protein
MRICYAIALLGTAVPAFAQPRPKPAPSVRYEPKTHIVVDEPEAVEGTTASGDGQLVEGRRPPRHSSLIRVRSDFLPEMLKSAERL